ncbi:MAG: glycosyltransferase, partial [Woeseiaceae bacterium]
IKNVSVMGRGVNTTLFSPQKRCQELRNSWGVSADNEPVLLYVGRIAAEKNLDLAIETYHEMVKVNNKVKFVLVGDGPLLSTIKSNNPDFIFAGMQTGEELAKYYASSDIFVFPSMTETFGNVVLEAMASGLGVIAYDYAAASTHIYPGENGQLAYFGDSSEFIKKACMYLSNYLLLQRIKMTAGHYALNQNWGKVALQFEEILLTHAGIDINNQAMFG